MFLIHVFSSLGQYIELEGFHFQYFFLIQRWLGVREFELWIFSLETPGGANWVTKLCFLKHTHTHTNTREKECDSNTKAHHKLFNNYFYTNQYILFDFYVKVYDLFYGGESPIYKVTVSNYGLCIFP